MQRKFKAVLLIAAMLLMSVALTGCGEMVEIPPAHVGKMSTGAGLQEGTLPPSKIRINRGGCPFSACDGIILVETSDQAIKEEIVLFMPQDKLNLTVEIRGTISIAPAAAEAVFSRITADPTGQEHVSLIKITKVYLAYAQPIIKEQVRQVVASYTIAEVMENRERISHEMAQKVSAALKGTPITVANFGFANVQPPQVIIDAEQSAKQREIAVKQAEADKLVALKQAEAALEVARKQQEVDLLEAETQVLVNKKLAEGVNNAFIAQRGLGVLEELAKSDNHLIIIPQEAFGNPTLLLGAMNASRFGPAARTPAAPAKVEEEK